MQRIRTEILPGVWLTALRTEKFKTAWLSVNLLTQLRRSTAACTAVLPYVLRLGCTRLPDLEAIAAELDGLYGAHITPVVHKLGEIQAVGFEADFADDGALGEEIFPRLAADVADLLLHPNTRGGLLRPDIVDSERTQLIARIRAAVNNKRSYARERLYTHMCCCEDFAVPRLGEEADAERIHYRKLTMRYHDLLSTSPVEIFYCGSIDGKRVARILTDVLATMPRGVLDEDIGTDIRMNALEEQPRYVTETLPVAQAQLAVGYRLGTCMEDPDLPVLFVLNALYGGCVTSKLFLNLRERLSLCYSVGSQLDTHKGLLTVTSGIDANHYERALTEKNRAEDITRVLYPNDSTVEGKRLRIKQQYFLSSASLQDILRTYKSSGNGDLQRLGEFIAVQLNDTHPAMSIPELIRLLMAEGIDFDRAFAITRSVFSYTNHTVMGEALERWDMDLLRSVVPEICDILLKIEERLQQEFPGANLHVVCDNQARMADLSVYMSRKVNGVAEIHSQILRDDLFRAWNEKYPDRIVNVTNGITPRRWLGLCNPELTELIRAEIGEGFLRDLDRIGYLREHVSDELAMLFNAVKLQKKSQLAAHIRAAEGVDIPEEFVFDVQVKRAHEYKRQLMNALCLADFYFEIKNGGLADMPPTAFIFGAKAAPGYVRAKAIIRYINRVAELVNNDPAVADKMKVVFVQNYNCSYAEHIIPAADISEQISPAGTEASGTGNMKLMLNGAVTLGTMDGANVEIVERAGLENNYIFGASVEELNDIRESYCARDVYHSNPRIKRAVDTLVNGTVPTDSELRELYTSLLDGASWHRPDHYFVLKDLPSYQQARLQANRDYRDRVEFGRKCLMNVASAGYFSSDRTIRQYAKEIWKI